MSKWLNLGAFKVIVRLKINLVFLKSVEIYVIARLCACVSKAKLWQFTGGRLLALTILGSV